MLPPMGTTTLDGRRRGHDSMSEKILTIRVQTWTVRVWYGAYDDVDFIDEMPRIDYHFATEKEALAFKKAFNDKFWNHGGWEPHIVDGHQYGYNYVAGEPAVGPYQYMLPETFSVEESLNAAYAGADIHGMEEE